MPVSAPGRRRPLLPPRSPEADGNTTFMTGNGTGASLASSDQISAEEEPCLIPKPTRGPSGPARDAFVAGRARDRHHRPAAVGALRGRPRRDRDVPGQGRGRTSKVRARRVLDDPQRRALGAGRHHAGGHRAPADAPTGPLVGGHDDHPARSEWPSSAPSLSSPTTWRASPIGQGWPTSGTASSAIPRARSSSSQCSSAWSASSSWPWALPQQASAKGRRSARRYRRGNHALHQRWTGAPVPPHRRRSGTRWLRVGSRLAPPPPGASAGLGGGYERVGARSALGYECRQVVLVPTLLTRRRHTGGERRRCRAQAELLRHLRLLCRGHPGVDCLHEHTERLLIGIVLRLLLEASDSGSQARTASATGPSALSESRTRRMLPPRLAVLPV